MAYILGADLLPKYKINLEPADFKMIAIYLLFELLILIFFVLIQLYIYITINFLNIQNILLPFNIKIYNISNMLYFLLIFNNIKVN